MAEIAGLVVGGISLAAIFDQCIIIIKHVDSGMNCSDEYQDAVLMLTLLGGRLNRWERTLRDSADTPTTDEDGENAELWLKQIRRRLEEAEKLGERYSTDRPTSTTTIATKRSTELVRMTHKLREKILLRANGLSVGQRARWALFDQDKMKNLLDKVDKLVGSLEQLTPSLKDKRIAMAKTDVAGLLEPGAVPESSEALEALKAAAAKVDKDFAVAAAASSHTYRSVTIADRAMANVGDFYSVEWAKAGGSAGQGGSNTYDGIHITGDGTANIGTMFGGKSVFEMSQAREGRSVGYA